VHPGSRCLRKKYQKEKEKALVAGESGGGAERQGARRDGLLKCVLQSDCPHDECSFGPGCLDHSNRGERIWQEALVNYGVCEFLMLTIWLQGDSFSSLRPNTLVA
jgi:hypothetical protein